MCTRSCICLSNLQAAQDTEEPITRSRSLPTWTRRLTTLMSRLSTFMKSLITTWTVNSLGDIARSRRATSPRRRLGRTLTKLRSCFAWRVKWRRRKTYTFRGTCTVDPSTFGTRHRPWTLPRRCGTVRTRTTTRTLSNLRLSLTRTGIGSTTTPFTSCTVRALMLFGVKERVHCAASRA